MVEEIWYVLAKVLKSCFDQFYVQVEEHSDPALGSRSFLGNNPRRPINSVELV